MTLRVTAISLGRGLKTKITQFHAAKWDLLRRYSSSHLVRASVESDQTDRPISAGSDSEKLARINDSSRMMEVLVLAAHDGALLEELRSVILQAVRASMGTVEILESPHETPEAFLLADHQLLIKRNRRCSASLATFLRLDATTERSECESPESESVSSHTSRESSRDTDNDTAAAVNATSTQMLKRIHKRDRKIKTLTVESDDLKTQLAEALARATFVEHEQEQFFQDVQHMKDAYDKLHSSHQKLLWEYLPSKDPDMKAIPRLSRHFTESEAGIGPYALSEVLGYGQYAVVYASETPDDAHEPLAIKAIDKEKLLDLVTLHRVNAEIESLRDPALHHPSILALRDVIHTKRHIYLVTERGGKDLFEYFGPHDDGIPEEIIKALLTRVALAVQTLHRHNYCHRDLKPENILYAPDHASPEHIVKLVDFGLCTRATSPQDDMLHDFCGSPGFFAPELLLHDRYDGRKADVWSLGCILLELIVGNERFATMWMAMYELETLKDRAKFAQFVHQSVEAMHTFCHSSKWHYSPSLRSLLVGLLCESPTERLTVDQLLAHEWLHIDKNQESGHTTQPQPVESHGDARSPSRVKLSLPSPSSFTEGYTVADHSPAGTTSSSPLSPPETRRLHSAELEPPHNSPQVSVLPSAISPALSTPAATNPATEPSSPPKTSSRPKVTLPSISPEKPATCRSPDKSFAKRTPSHSSVVTSSSTTLMPTAAPNYTSQSTTSTYCSNSCSTSSSTV